MNAAIRRELWPLLRDVVDKQPVRSLADRAAAFLRKHAKKAPATFRREMKRVRVTIEKTEDQLAAVHRQIVRDICVLRANGICECGCGQAFEDTVAGQMTMDHFYGREYETPEECWMLRWDHHEKKGRNHPSRAVWDAKFRAHCDVHGYTFRPRLTKELQFTRKEK